MTLAYRCNYDIDMSSFFIGTHRTDAGVPDDLSGPACITASSKG